MKTTKKSKLLMFLLGLFSLLCVESVQATAPRIAAHLFDERKADIVSYEITPLVTATQTDGGLAIAILSAAFNASGEKLIIDILPAKPLAKYALLNNEVVAMIGTNQDLSAKEKTQVLSEVFYLQIGRYFYFKPHHPAGLPWQSKLTDLKGLKYGGLYGSEQTLYQNAGIAMQEGDVRSLFEKLHSQELDFIGVPDLVGEFWLNKAYPQEQQDFASLNVIAWEQPLAIFFAKNNPRSRELHKAFVTGLEKILKNGQYQQLLAKAYGKQPHPADYAAQLQSYRTNVK
jgi:ABC-type amino acid transport substrate-binding protein